MSFLKTVEGARAFLERNERVSLRALQREFALDRDELEELVEELVEIQRIAVRECNGHQTYDGKWDEKAAQKDQRIELRLQTELTGLVSQYGIKPDYQGDPHGAVVKLQVPSGFYNDWGKGGICVPTRE